MFELGFVPDSPEESVTIPLRMMYHAFLEERMILCQQWRFAQGAAGNEQYHTYKS